MSDEVVMVVLELDEVDFDGYIFVVELNRCMLKKRKQIWGEKKDQEKGIVKSIYFDVYGV